MALELQLPRSKYFYGRLNVNGREHFLSLRVPVKGIPPSSLRDLGDPLFERQRAFAQAKLDRLAEQIRERATREELAQRVLEARTGHRLGSVPLSQMKQKWREIPRSRELAKRYVEACEATIDRFTKFLAGHAPRVKEMSQVDDTLAADFMRGEAARGITGKTYNDVLILLRSCYKRLRIQAGIASNPFESIPLRDKITVSRVPFSAEDIEAILNAAEPTPEIFGLIATGVSTAMRLGDCARLRWESLDLESGYVEVKRTSKTGASVTIPIFSPLKKALSVVQRQPRGYVFPTLAKRYAVNPDSLTAAVREVFKKAGFADSDVVLTGDRKVAVTESRADGVRRASLRGFASLRTTWVTLAVNSGVPIEMVMRVTGHRTAEMVRQHYHRPARDDFRQALASRLPKVLVGGEEERSDPVGLPAIVAKLTMMDEGNWRTLRDALLNELHPPRA